MGYRNINYKIPQEQYDKAVKFSAENCVDISKFLRAWLIYGLEHMPEDYLWRPTNVSLEQAMETLKRVYGTDVKITA